MLRIVLVSLCFSLALAQNLDDICEPGQDFSPHPDCTKYYICNNGIPIIGDCPSGLYWNQNIEACDFPTFVPECVGGTRPPVGPTTATPPTTTTITITTPDTTTPTTTTPTTTIPTTTIPDTTTPTTTTPTTTIVPTTEEETPETEPVPTTTTQPPSTTTRPPHTTTQPPPTTTTPVPTDCPPTGVIQIPYPGNCTLYRLCIDGSPIIYRCPIGNLFDTEARKCLPQGEAVCTVEGIMLIAGDLQFQIDQEQAMEIAAPEESMGFMNLRNLGRKFDPFRLD